MKETTISKNKFECGHDFDEGYNKSGLFFSCNKCGHCLTAYSVILSLEYEIEKANDLLTDVRAGGFCSGYSLHERINNYLSNFVKPDPLLERREDSK